MVKTGLEEGIVNGSTPALFDTAKLLLFSHKAPIEFVNVSQF